jgi:hypothetical protein
MADRWTEADLKRQFRYAKQKGWIPYFRASAASIDEPPELLLAIASRESNVKNIKGDLRNGRYNGYSLMQLDIGSHPAWIASGAWKDVRQAIQKGAEAYAEKRQQILDVRGGKQPAKAKAGRFEPARFSTAKLRHIALAAYNSGLNAYYSYSVDGDPDRRTTGKDYGRQVLARMAVFRELLEADEDAGRALASTRAGQASGSAEDDDGSLAAADPAPPPDIELATVEAPEVPAAAAVAAPEAITKVTAGSSSWVRQMLTWLGGLGALASDHVQSALGLDRDVQLALLGVGSLFAVVWMVLRFFAERQVRAIAADPTKTSVK